MSTMDNASAQLAIALQLQDLNELEASRTVDRYVIRLQRQQLENDFGFDAVTFEASRRLALSMAKAVEDDSALLAQSAQLPQIDDATFDRLASLNHSPSTSSNANEPAPRPKRTAEGKASKTEGNKRARPLTSEDETVIETTLSTAQCASCSDNLTTDKLVKASCEHYYCKDCFSRFVEASLQTDSGFPPKCCNIPLGLITIANNVSAAVFSRYNARQAEIMNATTLHCSAQECGMRIENDRIKGDRATCVTCWRDTCTLCRGGLPQNVDGRNIDHVCQKDKAREQVLALAKEQGWQTCFHCGHLVSLNFGCSHVR